MRNAWRLPRFPVMADKTSGRKKSEVFWSNMGICIENWLQYLHSTCLTAYQFWSFSYEPLKSSSKVTHITFMSPFTFRHENHTFMLRVGYMKDEIENEKFLSPFGKIQLQLEECLQKQAPQPSTLNQSFHLRIHFSLQKDGQNTGIDKAHQSPQQNESRLIIQGMLDNCSPRNENHYLSLLSFGTVVTGKHLYNVTLNT